jgi:peroxiredoxin Q/BCP
MTLEAGDAAPDFTLPDQDGKNVSLAGLKGETVVLYFYPRADTMSYNCSNDSASSHRHHPSL